MLDKGTDFAGDKISGNSGSFVEKMSYEDAKRYNQRDLAIEQGTYNNFPGLNSEDIAAWKFADLKVDEHVIVSNIDTDVAFDLSEADVDIQSDFATGIANASEYGGKIKLDDLDEVDSFYDEIYEQQSTSCDSYEVYLGDLRELHLESIAGVEGGLDSINKIDDLLVDPSKLAGVSGDELYEYLIKNGYDVKPLSKGSYKGIPFEEGGGFKVNWGGDRILQYHPADASHHGGAYFKISSGEMGTIRIDLDGNIIE